MRLLGLALLLLGCSVSQAPVVQRGDAAQPELPRPRVAPDGSAGGEVGAAAACGTPGRICCPGNLCADAGCCVEGRCVEAAAACLLLEGVCQGSSCGGGRCGGVDQPCCARGSCTAPGSFCVGGTCSSCGDYGQACCPGQGCLAAGTACASGRCLPCGEPGQNCCAGRCGARGCCTGNRCVATGASCGREGRCEAGLCNACGAEGQACCQSPGRRPCEGAGVTCDFATLTCTSPCGAEGQPCCLDVPCGASLTCTIERPSAPAGTNPPPLRTCRPCGGAGQPCCQGDGLGLTPCADAGCCLGGLCAASGSACTFGAGPAGTCTQGRCQGCGQTGQACCPTLPRCTADNAICAATDPVPPPMVDPFTISPPRTCQGCGEPGQPCCPVNRCTGGCCVRSGLADGGTCAAEGTACGTGGLACAGGACGGCGGVGQPCCAGACTVASTACRLVAGHGERCLPCGNRGEPCCTDPMPFGLAVNGNPTCPGGNLICRGGFCTEP